jgi:hypothetical protein
MDEFFDHSFHCTKWSKSGMHNRHRDTLYYILQKILPFTEMVYTKDDIAREPSSLLPQFPNIRPADVAIKLTNHHHSHLLIDVTCIPLPHNVSYDPNPLSVIQHHEVFENTKFRRPNDKHSSQVLQSMLDKHYLLLLCTIDPLGGIGPLASDFLFRQHRLYHNFFTPSPLPARPHKFLSQPISELLVSQTLTHLPHHIFKQADHGWFDLHGDTFFTPFYSTPSTWAFQTFAHNVSLASALHILEVFSALHPFSAHGLPPSGLLTASSVPRCKPSVPLHFLAQYRQLALPAA